MALGNGGERCIAGSFDAPFDLNDTAIESDTPLASFVACISPDATETRFAHVYSHRDVVIHALETDEEGGVYFAGSFEDTAIINERVLTSRGKKDAFVAALAEDGAMRWIIQLGGPNRDEAFALAVVERDVVYVTGVAEGPIDFGDGSGPRDTTAGDVFLARIEP